MVVVVQREPLYLRALLRFLRCLGYEAESLDALPHPPLASQVDVVVVDEDDLEVVPRGLRHCPRVVLGNGPPSAPRGQRAWVPKPFTGDELARAVMVAKREQDKQSAAVVPLSRDYEGSAVLLDRHERAQRAMEEEQVEVVVVGSDRHALLPRDEAEALPELEQEGLPLTEDGRFEVCLADVLWQP